MDVRDLGAIYLGGTSLVALARAGLVAERTTGAGAAVGAAFGWSQPRSVRISFGSTVGAALDRGGLGWLGQAGLCRRISAIVLQECLRSRGANGARRRLSSVFTSAWNAAAARRPVSVGVTRSARRSPGTGDRFTRPRRSALSTRPVSAAFSTPKQRASSAIPFGPSARVHRSLAWTGVKSWCSETRA